MLGTALALIAVGAVFVAAALVAMRSARAYLQNPRTTPRRLERPVDLEVDRARASATVQFIGPAFVIGGAAMVIVGVIRLVV